MTATIPAYLPTGDPATLVARGTVEAPEPAAADELVIAVEAYSVNRGEVFLLERPRPGWRPGQDVAGRVLRAAANGAGPPAGARVVAHAPSGGWATQVVVPASAVAALPDAVPMPEGATLGVAALTALRLVRAAGALAGRRVLVTGAAGGVGHAVTELAAGEGARVTVVVGTPARGARLAERGAAEVITDVAAAAGPFDVVIESVGGTTLPAALARTAPGGLVLWLGQASRQAPVLDFFATVTAAPGARIVPFSYWRAGASDADDLATLARLVETGLLHPEIGLLADWAGTPEALIAVRDRQVVGNAVLSVS